MCGQRARARAHALALPPPAQTVCSRLSQPTHLPPLPPLTCALQRALACQAKAQELNQLVVVSARGVGLDGVSDAELLGGSSSSSSGSSSSGSSSSSSSSSGSSLAVQPPLVIACDLDPPALVAACARCRRLAVPILAAATLAYHGFVFQDAGASRSYLHQPPAAQGGGSGGDAPAPPAQPRTAHFRSLAQVLEGSAAAAHGALARARAAQPAAHAWLALLCAGAGAGAGGGEGGGAALAAAWRARDAAALGAAAQEQLARGCSGGGGGGGAGVPAGAAAACAALAAAWAAGGELSPVAAVVGAIVANEAMKVVTGKDAPMRSLLCFDGMGGTGGRVYEV